MKVHLVIPARFASTRFPGKPLARIAGKPMIQHVYERCLRSRHATAVLVATDDERIAEAVSGFGGNALMTPPELASGTERVAWAMRGTDADVIVNVQGDEPLLPDGTIDAAVDGLLSAAHFDIGTVAAPCHDITELRSPHVVKVAIAADGCGLYFSRLPVPYVRDDDAGGSAVPLADDDSGTADTSRRAHGPDDGSEAVLHYRHIGLYAFRGDALRRFAALPPSRLEMAEKLEQLRALEAGMRIHVAIVEHGSPGVDTPEDLRRAEEMLS